MEGQQVGPEVRKILAAFDGSEPAARAFILAEDLAKKYRAQLVVVTAVESPVPYLLPQVPPVDISAARESATSKARTGVEELMRRAKADGVDARAVVLDKGGSAVERLVEYAEREGVDLIVVGTRGLGAMPKALLGSVSSGLVSHARCHVLVVR